MDVSSPLHVPVALLPGENSCCPSDWRLGGSTEPVWTGLGGGGGKKISQPLSMEVTVTGGDKRNL